MKDSISVALIYIAFAALIGFAVYITQSAIPLLALIFTPSVSIEEGNKKKKEDG
ncbi:MAG: hypothetical protein JSV32_06495 [Dehalococcoidia bacterium]|nr:MAG: hypothetical protein JSV32_06495 [Dehalococcoidia bacterium]